MTTRWPYICIVRLISVQTVEILGNIFSCMLCLDANKADTWIGLENSALVNCNGLTCDLQLTWYDGTRFVNFGFVTSGVDADDDEACIRS